MLQLSPHYFTPTLIQPIFLLLFPMLFTQLVVGVISLPLLAALAVLARCVRRWFRQRQLHYLPGPPLHSFITGNIKQLFSIDAWDFHAMLQREYGRVVRIWGLCGDTQLYISDPKALYSIVIKDQDIFERPEMSVVSNSLMFGQGLLTTRGDRHRRQRKLLNPVFSIKHMRYMLPVFYRISDQLCDILRNKVAKGESDIDFLDWMGRMALELVGQGGLGYSFQALDENSSNEYGFALKNMIPAFGQMQVWRRLLPWACSIGTPELRRWIAEHAPFELVRYIVYLSDIMDRTSKEIVHSKKMAFEKGDEAVSNQIAEGRDIMSVLLKANMEAAEDERLPESEVIAQVSTLTFAAMDTTSNALSRILHLLAHAPDVQERLREEIISARADAGGHLDYDTLVELPYMEAVCRETLRLYPPVTQLLRTARKDTVLPLSTPVSVGENLCSELFIPEKTNIIIAIKAVNTDQAIWGEDAAKWKPERWLSPLPESVVAAGIPGVYSNTLTFFGGGRACIGFKFSQLEMKVVLSLLLSNFRFSPSKTKCEFKSTGIVTPFVDGRPSMPMNISLL